MMYLFPSSFFLLFFMVAGVFISVSSSNMFLIWCGLEMNLMGFIPLIIQLKTLSEVESAVKYFLIQSFGSAMILFGACYSFLQLMSWSNLDSNFFIILGLMVKLGIFPFYFWLPGVMANMSWVPCTLLATWQKVGPFGVMMSLHCSDYSIFLYFGMLSSLVGGLMGMNQVNIKSLLAYSSIGHMGWMLCVLHYSSSVSLVYLGVYLISNFVIFSVLANMNFYWSSSMKSVPYLMSSNLVFLGLGLLSLGGLPPFLGFFPKLLVMQVMVTAHAFDVMLVLILGTFFSLYYYINLLLNCCYNTYFWKGSVMSLFSFNSGFFGLMTLNVVGMMFFMVWLV